MPRLRFLRSRPLIYLLTAAILGGWNFLGGCQKKTPHLERPMIALLTDFGTTDPYVFELKNAIWQIDPDVQIVDVTHEAAKFNPIQAAYLLDKAVSRAQPGMVFVAVVDPGVGTQRRGLILRTRQGHVLVGPDNGIFSFVIEREGLEAAHVLENPAFRLPGPVSATFHGRDIFGPAAAHYLLGARLNEFGRPADGLETLTLESPTEVGRNLSGQVIHVDHFGNVITNLRARHLTRVEPGQLVTLILGKRTLTAPFLETYGQARDGQIFCLINSSGELEIAVPRDSAAARLGLNVGDRLIIRR